jgi:hypothetical protein
MLTSRGIAANIAKLPGLLQKVYCAEVVSIRHSLFIPRLPASKCHPVLVSKPTDFFDSFNNARDFAVSPQKLCRRHA